MNDMVDAVFGQPKNELLKLIQRSPPPGNPVVQSVEEVQQPQSGEIETDTVAEVDSSSAVQHDFQETNSFRPCTCAHCNGLVLFL